MSFNMQAALARKAELDSKGQKVPYIKLEEGVNVLRILPPFGTRDLPWVEFAVAYQVGPVGKQRSFTPRHQFGLDDPLQKYIERLQQQGDAISKREIERIRPKNKFHMFAVERRNEAEGPKHLQLPPKVMSDVLTIIADPDFGDITHPETGTDISISYKKGIPGKTFPEYHVSPKRNSSPLIADPELKKQWLSVDLFDKYALGKPADADYINAVLTGTIDEFIASKKGAAPVDLPDPEDETTNAGANDLPSAGDSSFNFGANAQQVAGASPPAAQVQQESFAQQVFGQPTVAAPAVQQVAQPTVQSPYPADQLFWVAVNGAAVQMSSSKVCDMILAGQDPQMLNADQQGGWSTASARGYKLVQPVVQAPPPPPAAPMVPASPPAAPAAPAVARPSLGLPQDEAAALEAQLQKFQSSGQSSQVASDLLSQLKQ